jgi:hypothetical protein
MSGFYVAFALLLRTAFQVWGSRGQELTGTQGRAVLAARPNNVKSAAVK